MTDSERLLQQAGHLLDARQLDEAIASFDYAERAGAPTDQCSAGRWTAYMLQGCFEPAWRESDAISRRGAPDPNRFWNGESVSGKTVMMRCLHGFGDAVQYLRFIPQLNEEARRVIVEVPPPMTELARCIAGVGEVITWGDAAPNPAPSWDIQIEVTELPYWARCNESTLTRTYPYLTVPAVLMAGAAHALPSRTRYNVGVVWSPGEWNLSRAIPLNMLEPILSITDIDFWNLQGGAVRNAWRQLQGKPNIHDATGWCADAGLVPLAAFISQLDLVLTVDTLAAHIAGALGVPAWILLQYSADWRWMGTRRDSPWYPSVRLFRQPAAGDWYSVVRAVHQQLEERELAAEEVA